MFWTLIQNTLQHITMKKIVLLIFISSLSLCTSFAQTPQAKKAAQAVFSLNTFRADGTLISTSHGVFTSADGEAIAQWKPFVGASSAVVIDAQGKKHEVEGLIGANDLYDVCKFRVSGTTPSASIASENLPEKSQLWLACYSVKTPKLLPTTVSAVETFSQKDGSSQVTYPFYILNINTPEDADFCPVISSTGDVVGLLQKSSKPGTANAISAKYPASMIFQQLGSSASTLTASNIPVVLPSDLKEAQVALVLAAQQRKPEAYRAMIEQFIKKFPNDADGYQARARFSASQQDFAAATADMEKSISVAIDKAEAHNNYSELILDKEIYMSDVKFDGWNLDKALSESKAAYAVANNPAYLIQQGKVLFAQKKFDDACDIYLKLQDTPLAGPETLYSAVQCKVASAAPLDDIIELMDSTIAICPHPLTYQSAPYIFQRGLIYQDHGAYRKAWQDYNQYEKLMVGNQLPAEFYYNRFICEREAKIYQQALDDIQKAIDLMPNVPAYHCEQGSFFIRMKKYDEAINAANRALIINNRTPEAYAVLGVAQCSKGQKHEGMLNLEQAKSLGYEQADELIKRYK